LRVRNTVTQYDPRTRDGVRFVEYINTFLKLKAQASGYPSWFRSPADEERYIENFFAREGVRLDRDAVSPTLLNEVWQNCV